MQRITTAVVIGGLAIGGAAASAQGIGSALQNQLDNAAVQQRIQEQTQQRVQAQAEAQAQARAQFQAQQTAERVQRRAEAAAQNQAARVEAAAERIAVGVQKRAEAIATGAANVRAGQQGARAGVQARSEAETEVDSSSWLFGPWNPLRSTAFGGSAKARGRTGSEQQPTWAESRPSDDGSTAEERPQSEEGRSPGREVSVGQFGDLRGQARAELARSMSLRLAAISAMRDRAIEAGDVRLLERTDRLEAALRSAHEARNRGQVDAQAETMLETELPTPPAPGTGSGSLNGQVRERANVSPVSGAAAASARASIEPSQR